MIMCAIFFALAFFFLTLGVVLCVIRAPKGSLLGIFFILLFAGSSWMLFDSIGKTKFDGLGEKFDAAGAGGLIKAKGDFYVSAPTVAEYIDGKFKGLVSIDESSLVVTEVEEAADENSQVATETKDATPDDGVSKE